MGKITVKHYLNTKIKPKEIAGKLFYPVYINIIYNKFTTDKKCSSEILATVEGYNNYVQKGEWVKEECKKKSILSWGLNKELHIIDCAIRIIDDWNIKVDRKSILPLIDGFSHYASKSMLECYFDNIGIQHSMMTDEEFKEDYIGQDEKIKYLEFLLSFNEGDILMNIGTIRNYTGIDLKEFLNSETILDMEAIRLVSNIEQNEVDKYSEPYKYGIDWVLTFGEFVYCGYEDKIKTMLADKPLSYYQNIDETIKNLINRTIEHQKMYCCIEE